jgi:glycogen(starch) synthase
LKTAFSLAFGDSIISDACQIIALTEVERQRLRDYGIPAEQIVRIPNGVSGDYRVTSTQAENFRSEYGYDDSWLVTFVGRLHPTKGLDVLMDTAEDLQGQTIDGKTVQFAIVGPDDGYRKHLDNRVDSLTNVDLLGYLPEDEKNAALTATDVYVHPSTYETKPQSALEACAAGTPVLISDESSFPEIDTHDAGRVLKRSPDAFSGEIVDLLRDDTERERMADSAIELIENEFTWDAVASQLETLYASCRNSNP